jgi:hypothetical protein
MPLIESTEKRIEPGNVRDPKHLQLREEITELFDDLGNSSLNALQPGNDADIRPIITKLPERYERGEFHPHIHFSVCDRRFGSATCCGVFMNAHKLLQINLRSLLGSGTDDCQLPMLIKAVHIMKNEQCMMRTVPLGSSVVWL